MKLSPDQAIDEKTLADNFKLCRDRGAKPVVVALPAEKTCKADTVKLFRDKINKLTKEHKAAFIDLLDEKFSSAEAIDVLITARLYFINLVSLKSVVEKSSDFFKVLAKDFPKDYKKLTQHIFCKLACDDFKRLSKTLPRETLIDLMADVFAEMTYNHLANLSDMLNKDDYNDLAARVFELSAEKIRRKDKIKVGFYFAFSSFCCSFMRISC